MNQLLSNPNVFASFLDSPAWVIVLGFLIGLPYMLCGLLIIISLIVSPFFVLYMFISAALKQEDNKFVWMIFIMCTQFFGAMWYALSPRAKRKRTEKQTAAANNSNNSNNSNNQFYAGMAMIEKQATTENITKNKDKTCQQCGTKLAEQEIFCGSCGTRQS